MIDVGVISYSISAVLFLLLSFFAFVGWRSRQGGFLLIAALFLTSLWSAAIALVAGLGSFSILVVFFLEVLRNILWLALSFRLVFFTESNLVQLPRLKLWIQVLLAACILLYVMSFFYGLGSAYHEAFNGSVPVLGHVFISILGLVLVEQLIRNVYKEEYWAYKFLCLGLGCLFIYDLFLYSDALLFGVIDSSYWDARGVISALAVPLIMVSMRRNKSWLLKESISHRMAFHTAVVVSGGVYIVVMVLAGHFIRDYGGDWGGVIQVAFLSGAMLFLLLVVFSTQIRAYLKVYLAKNFFAYKYDYRDQWMNFIRALSMGGTDEELKIRAIKVIADIVDSPAGVLWLDSETDRCFVPVSEWNMAAQEGRKEARDGSLPTFLERWQWVINVNEYNQDPSLYKELELPLWLNDIDDAWLIVPLMRKAELFGFVVLAHSRAGDHFNWEDIDLLRIAGRELAGYLSLLEANRALVDARQFDAFNRLSAYVVHDLKNVVGQLSLVVDNSKKYRDNPEFIDDAFGTIDNAVGKMSLMLSQLRGENEVSDQVSMINLCKLLIDVGRMRVDLLPNPSIKVCDTVYVLAEHDRLMSVMGHLIQNAQEAVSDDGFVKVTLESSTDQLEITIQDNGCGMDETFIRERLFRPFDTTKGNAGMGIGVYEAREFIHSLGGQVQVRSIPGQGTEFIIKIPRYYQHGGDEHGFV